MDLLQPLNTSCLQNPNQSIKSRHDEQRFNQPRRGSKRQVERGWQAGSRGPGGPGSLIGALKEIQLKRWQKQPPCRKEVLPTTASRKEELGAGGSAADPGSAADNNTAAAASAAARLSSSNGSQMGSNVRRCCLGGCLPPWLLSLRSCGVSSIFPERLQGLSCSPPRPLWKFPIITPLCTLPTTLLTV